MSQQPDTPLVDRAVRRALAPREAAARAEVQRLIDAALAVIRRNGTEAPPRVADIVAEAGLSNQAFYRHFSGREELLAAVAEQGASRLVPYLEHQMAKEHGPAGQLRRWVEGVMVQASKPVVARDTRAVLWSARGARAAPRPGRVERGEGGRAAPRPGGLERGSGARAGLARPPAEELLIAPLSQAGRPDPERDAAVIATTVFARLEHHLWVQPPTDADVEHLVSFCLTAVGVT
jgi:AcrR family transcriptional regulator